MTIERQKLTRNFSPEELENIRRRLAAASEAAMPEHKSVNYAQIRANKIGNQKYLERIERAKRR